MNKSKLMLWIIVLAFLAYLIYQFAKENFENHALKNSKPTVGVLIEIHTPQVVRGSYYGVIKYEVNGKEYEMKSLDEDYSMLKVGDSVQIEYSVEDYSIARLVDKYYMKKNRHLNPDTIPNRQL